MVGAGGRTGLSIGVIAATAVLASLGGTFGGIWLWNRVDDPRAVGTQLQHAEADLLGGAGADDIAGSTSAGSTAGDVRGSDAVAMADHPVLIARLEAGRFELEGVVPNGEVAAEIRDNVLTVYGHEIVDRLAIDPRVDDALWLPMASDVVVALPIISSGSVRLEGTTATIEGVAGSEVKHQQFRRAIGVLLGADVEVLDEVTVDHKEPPSLVIRKSGAHTIEVTGVVPTEGLRDEIEEQIVGAYAGYAIETDFTVDPAVEDTFTLHSLPEFAELFFGFPAWELSYLDENLQSSSSGSAAFNVGSAALPTLGEKILDNVAARLAGTPGLHLAVEGHTDSAGAEEFNEELSERRARAVVDYLVSVHDVDSSRLSAAGFGEDRPIDTNDTAEGRERNRRVDFRFMLEQRG